MDDEQETDEQQDNEQQRLTSGCGILDYLPPVQDFEATQFFERGEDHEQKRLREMACDQECKKRRQETVVGTAKDNEPQSKAKTIWCGVCHRDIKVHGGSYAIHVKGVVHCLIQQKLLNHDEDAVTAAFESNNYDPLKKVVGERNPGYKVKQLIAWAKFVCRAEQANHCRAEQANHK